jgi:hypothetical protein
MNIDELAIPDIQWDKPYTKTVLDLASEPDSIRHSIHEGGTRSGKSFSIIDRLISLSTHKSNRNHRLTISIVRKTLPALKKSVLKDFLEIIDTENIKCEVNKSD